MKLVITIHMDNAAFEPNNGLEAGRILEAFGKRLQGWEYVNTDSDIPPLRDVNGNKVGTVVVEP